MVEEAAATIQALNGSILPGSTQPLLVRFADSPAEKAAKAARKERMAARTGGSTGALQALVMREQLQKQLLEMVGVEDCCWGMSFGVSINVIGCQVYALTI